eukprot:gnl/Dysnectes_brevis/1918_a2203_1643.p1 GENE.gnl/Dysnectes_brevis/1918_a2203_1643~~gnl/Dysnectes_brevis/1918_a2203_1643.p1  ORF type:complete len:726 (+),score=323.93 gnl/Dysnectes_brevis/1918_a2203_1643:41-2218(+)
MMNHRFITLLIVLALSVFVVADSDGNGFFPFNEDEGFSLGIEDIPGRIAIFGDVLNDKFMDIVVITEENCVEIYTSQSTDTSTVRSFELTDKYTVCPLNDGTFDVGTVIIDVAMSDFTRNGFQDLLVTLGPGTLDYTTDSIDRPLLQVMMYPQVSTESMSRPSGLSPLSEGSAFYPPLVLPSTYDSPVPTHMAGIFHVDLLVVEKDQDNYVLRILQNSMSDCDITDCYNDISKCFSTGNTIPTDRTMRYPLDVSMVDVTGSCTPELAIVTQDFCGDDADLWPSGAYPGTASDYSPWLATETCYYVEYYSNQETESSIVWEHIPGQDTLMGPGAGMTLWFDLNTNANTDLSFPVCRGASCTTESSIHQLYNEQLIPCASSKSSEGCRGKQELCQADDDFKVGATDSDTGRLVTMTEHPVQSASDRPFSIPSRLIAVDYHLMREPSLMLPAVQDQHLTLDIYDLHACQDQVTCTEAFYTLTTTTTDSRLYPTMVAQDYTDMPADACVAGQFVDLTGRGVSDILLNCRDSTGWRIHALQNMVHASSDGFFLKATGLNGLCFDSCSDADIKLDGHYYTTSFPGTVFKYVTSDMSNIPQVGVCTQLGQANSLAMGVPYCFWGLGRIAQYIDTFYVGNNVDRDQLEEDSAPFYSWAGIVPDAQVMSIPYPNFKPEHWEIEVYLPDAESAVFWTSVVTLAALVLILVASAILQCADVRVDRKEEDKMKRLFV